MQIYFYYVLIYLKYDFNIYINISFYYIAPYYTSSDESNLMIIVINGTYKSILE
jgi:hypothetical protein